MVNSFLSALSRSLLFAASLLVPFGLSLAAPSVSLDLNDATVRAIVPAQDEVTAGLMQQPEVLGTAVGLHSTGAPALIIYVDREATTAGEVVRSLPDIVRGIGTRVQLTDKFRAMQVGGGPSHTAKQTPPIKLGTSGGWSKDLANGFCCGGTLGSLVSINGVKHILSNYHVFESDIVPGGNGTVAKTGDPVIQPGLIDVKCSVSGAQTVATLVKKSSLPNNNVDCSVAKVVPGMVKTNGAILEIGALSSQTIGASLNQKVKKSGRTTGLTRSSISGLNATIRVQYDNECAGGVAFTKTFRGQIVVSNLASRFLDSGDSGSLMVEDAAHRPRAVGLLFAGSSTDAIANPIDEVLSFLGATMVGN